MPKITGKTVEKVPKQILGWDAEKNDFIECATINDLTIIKGRDPPKKQALTILKGFSTVSADTEPSSNGILHSGWLTLTFESQEKLNR